MPFSSAARVTFVPGFQYSSGRQSTRSLPEWSCSQPQEPSVSFEVDTLRAFSTAALFFTGWSKTTDTGWAIPTVVFLPGASDSLFTFSASAVVKVAVSLPPSASFASTVYAVPGAATRSDIQLRPSADIFPASAPPSSAVTETVFSFPSASVTFTGSPGAAALPWRFTEMLVAGALASPPSCAAEPDAPPPEQAVSAAASSAAGTAVRAVRRWMRGRAELNGKTSRAAGLDR